MGTIIAFPEVRRRRPARWRLFAADATPDRAPARIVILPVVRIERHGESDSAGASTRGKNAGGR